MGQPRGLAALMVVALACYGCRKSTSNASTGDKATDVSAPTTGTPSEELGAALTSEVRSTASVGVASMSTAGGVQALMPPALTQECTRRELAQARQWGAAAARWSDTGKCSYGTNDAWLVELREFSRSDEGTTGCPVLVHVRTDGTSAERFLLHPFNVPTCRGQSCWADGCEPFELEDSIGYSALAVHDWDDDGNAEVAVEAWARLSMARSTSRVLVLEDNGRQLQHLPSTLSLDIVGVKDADADRRPDFLLRFSSGVQVAEDGHGWVSAEEFNLLAHSLPQGHVSVVDDVARSFAAAQCANIARTDVYDEQSLLCAKLFGVAYGVALDAFRKACENSTTGGCSIEPGLVWDAWRLPFTL